MNEILCIGDFFKLHQHLIRTSFPHESPSTIIEILKTKQRPLDTSKVNNTNPTSSKPDQ